MNPPPGPGSHPLGPIWHPPIASKWIAVIIVVFLGAVANRIPHQLRFYIIQPVGFFLIALSAMVCYWMGFYAGTFALFFFLLSIWSAEARSPEGFLNASNTVDWVTNSKKWFVEKVLKEQPLAIQEKDVSTSAISD
jgi:hypothetical protein